MKINNLKINGYGNIQNKQINLKEKINIIYGKNESGKSTIFKFIINMLYGSSKNKKGQEISDFEKYTPWNAEEFSGKINYELDNKNRYEVFREFKKKNPKIYNENSEDITKEFNIDKTKGIDYFYEQTNIDEELFLSSTAIMQENVKLEKANQNLLIQKITNLMSTGEDNISYKKTIDKLNKKQLEEIGTSRSINKPINKIENEITNLKINKNNLELFKNEKYEIENKKEKIDEEINKLNKEIELIKQIKEIKQKSNIEKEKIKINEEIILNNNKEIENLKSEKIKKEELINKIKGHKKDNKTKKYNYIFLILFFVSMALKLIIKNNIFIFLAGIFLIIFFILTIIFKNKDNKIKNENKNEIERIKREKEKIENQIELINENIKEEKLKLDLIKNNLKNKINEEKQKIDNKNTNEEINNLFLDNNIENILEENANKLNNKKVEKHKLILEEENINQKLEELILVDEQLEYLNEELENLEYKNKVIEFTKEILENSYKKMKENITPKFTQNLSNIIKDISDEKYKKIKFNTEDGLIVEKENGEYILANRLSTGTIDQLYLAFRLSVIKEITNEKIPIILDEAFAYYDEKRLENILKYLYEKTDNQIIIFTCTNREREILNKLELDYNLIEL